VESKLSYASYITAPRPPRSGEPGPFNLVNTGATQGSFAWKAAPDSSSSFRGANRSNPVCAIRQVAHSRQHMLNQARHGLAIRIQLRQHGVDDGRADHHSIA
jgi:hypothetical protein